MNGIHDNTHKRTSITELLNPVANGAPHSVDTPNFPSGQVNGYTGRQYISPDHPSAVAERNAYHPVMNVPGGSFSLRAASWDQQNANQVNVNSRRDPEAEYSSACQYTSSPPHAYTSSDTEYPDSYARPRPTGERTNIGMATPPTSSSWPHPPSHESPPSSYSSAIQAPVYSNERTAIAGKPPSKEYPSPQTALPTTQQSQQLVAHQTPSTQYRQDSSHQTYNGNGFLPVMIARAPAMHSAIPHPASPPGVAVTTPTMYMHTGVMPYSTYSYAYVPQPPNTQSVKRALETEDEDAGGKAKKARGKPTTPPESNGNGTSKRKKRNEAVPGSPFNSQAMAAMSKDKGKSREPPLGIPQVVKMMVATAPMHLEPARPKMDPELQSARCMSNRYKSTEFPRCVSCTRRWAGDTCRFQGVRYFLKDAYGSLVGISFVEGPQEDPNLRFPDKWNISFSHYYINRIKRAVAQALLPVLKDEQQHQQHKGVIRRQRETDVRATCDTCMTSLFACTWMCRQCGREACKDCYGKIEQLTVAAPDAGPAEVVGLQAKKERHAHQNPFFLACNRRSEHTAAEFNRVSRFSDEELNSAVEAMESYLATPEEPLIPLPAATRPSTANNQATNPCDTTQSQAMDISRETYNPVPLISVPLTGTPQPLPTHSVQRFTNDEFNDMVFHDNWKKGEPLVVTGTLSNFKKQWTPQYLSDVYGHQEVVLLDCQGEGNKRLTVAEFFADFGNHQNRKEIWKLKDWPPTQDFKTAFPDLYNDFAIGTPVPNYVRRDGVLNLASHFPTNTVSPDMGPKMYNAMASSESPGSKGTTRLHMDASDAVNVMMYASDGSDGNPGCAVWDLYRPEDSIKLKKFLRRKCKSQLGPNHQRDPIHSQQCFLDSQLRQELFEETGIMSFRIYQRPGDAVFIPAGYTHQVCNLADCIKVATDFVSPENIARCEVLTREFRDQNQSGAWKEDILQLRTMMWFAWLSCINQEKELAD